MSALAPTKQDQMARSAHPPGIARDIIFGSISGSVGKLFEYPFDTIKVRLQSQRPSSPTHLPYTGPLDCFQQSIRLHGLRGLYRGLSAPLFGAAVETSSLFFTYNLAQSLLTHLRPQPFSIPDLVACGALSGALTSLLLTPIELVKCKMQVPHTAARHAPSLPTLIRTIYAHHGLRGFWRGQLGTLIRETGGSAAWFGSYEAVSALFRRNQKGPAPERNTPLPLRQQLLAGASAGVAYSFLFYPADTVKSHMQTEEVGWHARARPKSTFASVGVAMWKQHGVRAFYRGCGITVARAAPSSALIFTVYEALQEWVP